MIYPVWFLYRYCLWILGNETTLVNSGSIWKQLVVDAKDRGCFYNANEDKNLAQAAMGALVELRQLDSLFSMNSLLFSEAKWKVFGCFFFGLKLGFSSLKLYIQHRVGKCLFAFYVR